jgi:hypothetical protein
MSNLGIGNTEIPMSKLNSHSIKIATGVLLGLALSFMVTPLLIVTSIAVGLFYYIHSTTRAARLEPVKVRRDE